MQFRSIFAAILASSILAACGGGGDSSPAPANEPSPPPTPQVPQATLTEGLYLGTTPTLNPQTNSVLVLENGETWAYEPEPSDIAHFFGEGNLSLIEQTTSKASTTTGTVTVDQTLVSGKFGNSSALISGNEVLGTGPLTFVSDPTADGKSVLLRVPGQSIGVALATVARDGYDYNQPANPADVTGTWDFLTVSSTGAISGTASTTGCTFSGSMLPRPSGKNVFNVALNVSDCVAAGSYSGVAYKFTGTGKADPFAQPAPTFPRMNLLAIKSDKTRVMTMRLLKK